MTFRLKIFLFLASLTFALTSAEARVHRRSVGPVILDLGSLPPLPGATGDPQLPDRAEKATSQPQVDGTPETARVNPEPLEVRGIYPSHAQPLGPLVLTRQPEFEPVEDITSSNLLTELASEAPVLISHYHPTLAADHALLNPSVDSATTPVVTAEPPADQPAREFKDDLKDDLKAETETAPPVERLRTLVIWVWRLLFFIGVVALIVTLLRRRRHPGQPVSSPPVDDVSEPEFSAGLGGPRVLRASGTGERPTDDSLPLMTVKTGAALTTETRSKSLGLIEPGAARSPSARGGRST